MKKYATTLVIRPKTACTTTRESDEKKQAVCLFFVRAACSLRVGGAGYFFLTAATLVWLTAHLLANACRSFRRLSRSVPSGVTL